MSSADEAIRLVGGGHAERDALGYLCGQVNAGIVPPKAVFEVPALRLGFDGNVPETRASVASTGRAMEI